MPDMLEAQWTFTPREYFEEAVDLTSGDCTFAVTTGEVRGCGPLRTDDCHRACKELHQRLDALFLGAQMLEHQKYELSEPSQVVRVTPDGGRHNMVLPPAGIIALVQGRLDVVIKDDATGNVIRDDRRDRISARLALSRSSAAHIDEPVANSVIRSYAAAINDPRNELVHLYEIRDALCTRFGGGPNARTALGVSEPRWKDLGRLACFEPLLQGRHRGQHPESLRPAMPEELSLAREIARELVEKYLALLTKKGGTTP